jgi:hypothetical protein
MDLRIEPNSETVEVGPPGGPTVSIPTEFTIMVTDSHPYDVCVRTEWDENERSHVIRQLNFASPPGGERIRMSQIVRHAVFDLVETALEGEVLGPFGWKGVVEDHADADPVAVDALVYLLSIALEGQKPTSNVATARGLAPSSGPKRVAAARKTGLLPPADPGKARATTTSR